MFRRTLFLALSVMIVAGLGCGPKYRTEWLPPRVDLTEHDVIAVIEFDSSSEGQLGSLATRRFTDLARRDQGMVRMKNVAGKPSTRDGNELQRVGEDYGAQTVLIGEVKVSDIRPNISIARSLASGKLTANVDAELTVDLVETESGASIWSASARASRTIGQISVFDGKRFTFDAEDPEQAYGDLIDALVVQVTHDFRSRSIRRPIPR